MYKNRKTQKKTCKTYEGSFLFNKQTETQMQYSANWFLNDWLSTPTVRFLILLNSISAT